MALSDARRHRRLGGRRLTATEPPRVASAPGRAGWLQRGRAAFVGDASYPAAAADRREVDVVGLALPWRATIAIVVTTFVILFDYSLTFLPDDLAGAGRVPGTLFAIAVERAVLYGFAPLAIVLVVFRDHPARYGLRLGNVRAGLALVVVGCAVMTPLVLWFATLPDVRAFYAPSAAPLPVLLATNALDLTAAEFLFRGFLMFTLVRSIGPLGVLVATMPFVFGHLGKPELELLSTLGGGLVYGWLAWRTGSIVWGAAGHVYVLTLVTVAAGSGT